MQKFSLGLALCVSLTLTACVSESSYVGSDRQVGERSLDNSEAARTRISLGLNYLRRGDTTQAKYNLERARAFAPDLPEVYNALAFYYQSVGEHAKAEGAYQQALDKDSDNADAYNNYGAFLCQIGKYNEAEQLLLKAISRPGYIRVAESYENLALCQLDQQGFSKAKTFLESSVSHNGTRISSLINLAALNYAMGDNVEAKTALQRIQRLGRVSARSTLLNYLVAEKQGDVSTMKHAEQLLLTLYIDTPEARLLLQQRLLESEFEQLREQYKLSLMANIVLPEGTLTDVVPTGPVANPRLKVVRRKSPGQSIAEDDPAEQPPVKTATEAERTTTAASSVASQAIAGALVTSPLPVADNAAASAPSAQQIADEQAATNASQLAEQQAAEQLAVADAEAARQLAARQLAEQAMAEQQAIDKLAAEKQAADELAARQLADQQAEQLAQQQAAEPGATEEPVADMAPQPATGQQAADTEPPQTAFQQTADTEPAQTSGQQSEQNNDSQLVLAATPPISLPVETVLAESTIASANAAVNSPANIDNTVSDGATDSIAQTETESAQPSAVTVATEPPAEFHIVQEGESLYAISVAHNIRLARLMEWNQLTPESVIKTGQRVWLAEVGAEQLQQQQTVARLADFNEPLEATEPYHQVAAGETMFGISYRYNIRLERFMAWNDLTEQSKLQVGQQVLVIDPARIEP